MAFPCSLGGRYSTDYYGQSAPPLPLRPKHVSLSRARTGGSSVAVWLLDGGRVDFRTRSPRQGACEPGSLCRQALEPSSHSLRFHRHALLDDLRFSWHPRPPMPAAAWSRLVFANDRLTLSHHSERLPFGAWPAPHNSLLSPGS